MKTPQPFVWINNTGTLEPCTTRHFAVSLERSGVIGGVPGYCQMQPRISLAKVLQKG